MGSAPSAEAQMSLAQREAMKANVHSLARNAPAASGMTSDSPDGANRATPHYKITPRAGMSVFRL